jgi:CelD/BcsL family acetyltransferase involved in cellulose biosynthesis
MGVTTTAATVRSPAPRDEWEDVLASAADALPTQRPAWLRSVCAVDGYEDASRLYRAADGRRLVLPLVRRRVLGLDTRWAPLASLPVGWGPGGLLAEDGVVGPDDVRMVVADLARAGLANVYLRPDPASAAAWESAVPAQVIRQPGMAQTVPLDGGFDRVWRTRFRKDTRNRVRRAERAGVVVERDDCGALVPAFHRLYALSVARWAQHDGIPPALARWRAARREPEGKLRTVAGDPATGCRIYAAFHDGRPVAAIVVLVAGGAAAYWRGAMDEALAGTTYANYLLHRTAIQDAADAGCGAYHMGESAPGSPLALFKSRFGAIDQHYASYRIAPTAVRALAGARQHATRAARRLLTRGA